MYPFGGMADGRLLELVQLRQIISRIDIVVLMIMIQVPNLECRTQKVPVSTFSLAPGIRTESERFQIDDRLPSVPSNQPPQVLGSGEVSMEGEARAVSRMEQVPHARHVMFLRGQAEAGVHACIAALCLGLGSQLGGKVVDKRVGTRLYWPDGQAQNPVVTVSGIRRCVPDLDSGDAWPVWLPKASDSEEYLQPLQLVYRALIFTTDLPLLFLKARSRA